VNEKNKRTPVDVYALGVIFYFCFAGYSTKYTSWRNDKDKDV
jgi:hypothetical protein